PARSGAALLRLHAVQRQHRWALLHGVPGCALERGEGLGPLEAPADPGAGAGASGNGAADPDHARQSAGRAAQALRGDGALEGALGEEGDPEVPRAGGAQPVRQHHRLHAAVYRVRQHHRVAGPRPSDGRPLAAQGADRAGHVPGGHDRAAAGRDDGDRHAGLRHPAGVDRSAHPARGLLMAGPDLVLDPPTVPVDVPVVAPRGEEQRIYVASQWQLMWWRFRKHRLAVASGIIIIGFYLVVLGADFLAYADPNASEAQRSLMPPQPIRWFDGWRFRPHVYAVKGARDPQTFKRVYQADPGQRIPVRFFAEGFEYRFLGLIPMTRHLIGVEAGQDAGKVIFLLGTDVQGRDLWSRLMYGTRISLTIGLVGVTMSLFLGVLLGGLSGFYGGIADTVIQRVIEILRSIPTIPLWMGLAAALPRDWT